MRGHLKQRSKGSWTIWIDAGRDPVTGKRRQITRTVRGSKKEAESEMATLISRATSGRAPLPEKMTLAAYMDRWLDHQASRIRLRTLERYRTLANLHILPTLGATRIEQIRPGHVQAVLDKMRDAGLAPRTCIQTRAVLGAALRRAVAWELIPANPVTAVQPPKPERPQLTVPTAEQLAALISASKDEPIWEVPILLAATTGARRSEVLAVAWSSIDLAGGKVRITRSLQKGEHGQGAVFLDPKTARARREVVLLPVVVARLRRYRQEQLERRMQVGPGWHDLDLVCDRGDGRWITPDGFSDAFKRIAARAGLDPRTRLHDVRHGVATAMLERGVHPAIASAVLGHTSPGFTMGTYQHVLDGMTDQAATALHDALGLR